MNRIITALHESMLDRNSLVCCGLDPILDLLPRELRASGQSEAEVALSFLSHVVDLTADAVCAYKLQKAFFDSITDGSAVMKATVSYINAQHPAMPVFLDSKIGDIGNTMRAYLSNAFDNLSFDGVVVNPYMGDDVFSEFERFPDRAAIVLVKTSNRGADVIQDVPLASGVPLWKFVLHTVVERWNQLGNLIPVLSSAHDLDYRGIRSIIPEDMPVLLAGYGAQGGKLDSLPHLLNANKSGVFINSSRGLLYPYGSEEIDWREKITAATESMRSSINKHRFLA